MSRVLPVFLVPILMMVLTLTSCDPVPVEDPLTEYAGDPLREYISPVEQVNITVTSCTPDRFAMEVDHWVAEVELRPQAYQFQWTMDRTDDVDAFEIVPHGTEERPWPLDRPQRRPQQPPHSPVSVTIPPAGEVERGAYHYRIVIHCGDRVYDIDPEVWIR